MVTRLVRYFRIGRRGRVTPRVRPEDSGALYDLVRVRIGYPPGSYSVQ